MPVPELDLSPEIVCNIISHAREFQAKEGVVIPENPQEFSEDDFQQILADHANDLTFSEVQEAINQLEPDQQMKLVALMYLGRGDYSLEEWDQCLEEARQGWTTHTAEYLLSKPQIAEYLEAGLEAFGISCES